jgi:hypothetical protein
MNLGRRLAYDTFRLTLSDLLGREGITEVKFRNEWLVRLRDKQQLSTSGWYEPPPMAWVSCLAMTPLLHHSRTRR